MCYNYFYLKDMLTDNNGTYLSIISLNACGAIPMPRNIKKRFIGISEALAMTSANILCLQEVHIYRHFGLLRKKLAAQFPHIGYKRYLYGPKGGLVVFSKLPLEDVQYVGFSKRGVLWNKSVVARIIRNGMIIAKIKDRPLYIINTHLTPNTDSDWSYENRFYPYLEAQLDQVAETVRMLSQGKNDVIIAGDFNIPHSSTLYQKFMQMTNARDIFSEFTFPTYRQEFVSKDKEAQRLDFIFMANKTKASIMKKDHILQEKEPVDANRSIYLSDHIGLHSDILLQYKENN